VRALEDIVGPRHVLTSAEDLAPYEVDWTGRFRGRASCVVRPGNTDEVAAVLAACREAGVAVVAQGGNTGLVGGGVPRGGEVVLSLRRLDSIGDVDLIARQVTAGAGVTIAAVEAAAARSGLHYAVDFGARDSATVGGSVATNAGGLHVMRYGGTREQLLGVEAVLGDGRRITRLDGLVKDNTGYHLSHLLCGSEGTLGVVTAARLRLVPRYDERTVALIGFASVVAAVDAATAWRRELEYLEAIELMLADGVELVCAAFDLAAPLATRWPVYVLVEAAAATDPSAALARAVEATVGVGDVAVAVDAGRRTSLWRYRDDHTLAINTLGPPHKLDVSLPLRHIAAFAEEVPHRVVSAAPVARTFLFGHLGDGNLHVNISGVAPDDESVDDVVLRFAVELGGSISAEHGIGIAKRQWLHLSRSPDEIDAMRSIKRALDPTGIMNPGVLL